MAPAQEDGHIGVLAAEVAHLQNATSKLVESNAELRTAIEEEGDDEDRTFKTAIEENVVVIAKYRAQVERLQAELAELRAGRQQLGTLQAVPTQEAPTAAAAPAQVAAQPASQQAGQQQGGSSSAAAAGGQEGDTAMGEAGQEGAAGEGGVWM